MHDTTAPARSRRTARLPTGKLTATIITAAAMVASGLALQGPADAAPRRCSDGSLPPCDVVDPPEPTTSPTTGRPPTTTPTPAPPSAWVANAVILDQSPTPLGTVVAHRWFIPRRVSHPGATRKVVGTIFDPIPSGSAPLQGGAFRFAPVAQPAGTDVQLLVGEGGGRGPLCRTRPQATLPSSGGSIHILAAPPLVTGPAELDAMVAGITGELAKETDEAGTVQTVTATSASLTPQADGLSLTLTGTLDLDFDDPAAADWRMGFTFRQLLRLKASQSLDVHQSLVVELAGPASIDVTWVAGEPAEGGDAILTYVGTLLVPRMRSGVLTKAGPLINPSVAQRHSVRWWTEQGFTLSIRNVGYSTAGLSMEATLCRLG